MGRATAAADRGGAGGSHLKSGLALRKNATDLNNILIRIAGVFTQRSYTVGYMYQGPHQRLIGPAGDAVIQKALVA